MAIVTCAELPELDDDGPALQEALQEVGVRGVPAVWDDEAVPWHQFDAAVLRSTWDYAVRRAEFLEWARSVSARTRLFNSFDVVEWNTDKVYLRQLADAGVPVVPTCWWDGCSELPEWPQMVVKPCISAGCRDTGRFGESERDQARHLAGTIHAGGRQVMIQPYLEGVEERGETALVFFCGQVSHAIRKGPLLTSGAVLEKSLFRLESIQARRPTPPELEVARQALDAMPFDPADLLYARVDMVPGFDGAPRVIELELTEPSLFLGYAEGAARRFAACLSRLL